MPTPLKQHHEQKEDLQQKQNSSPKFKTFQYIDHENERLHSFPTRASCTRSIS